MNKRQKIWVISVAAVISALILVLLFFALRISDLGQNPANAFVRPEITISSTPEPTENTLSFMTPNASPAPSSSPQTASSQSTSAFAMNEHIVAVSFLGIDSTPERQEKGMGWRSDAIIVCAVNLDDGTATAITIPRDTRAKVNKLNKNGKVTATVTDRINTAYGFGGGPDAFGHENALTALSDLLGVELTYYASIDMDSIGTLADAVDGVEITLDATIPGVGKEGETVLLKGDKATQYVRKRHGVTGGSDLARTDRQKQFVKALALKLKGMNALKAVPALVSTLHGRMRTNLNADQILALALALNSMRENDWRFETAPGYAKSISGKSYYIIKQKELDALVKEAFT